LVDPGVPLRNRSRNVSAVSGPGSITAPPSDTRSRTADGAIQIPASLFRRALRRRLINKSAPHPAKIVGREPAANHRLYPCSFPCVRSATAFDDKKTRRCWSVRGVSTARLAWARKHKRTLSVFPERTLGERAFTGRCFPQLASQEMPKRPGGICEAPAGAR